MAGEWIETPLSDLTDPDTPVTYGVVKPGEEDSEGVFFIRGGDIAGGRIQTGQLRTISKVVSQQYKRTLLRGGEIVMSLVGNPGQVAIVPESLRGANIARQAALIRLRPDVDTRFVMYYLSSPLGQEALGAHSRGSVQQVINLGDLKTVGIPTPPLAEQRAIAHILGTLDDKIELNRRMNETLEAIARAMFKSWFVDFDPVRAKMSGEPPASICQRLGLTPDLLSLFPDRLVDSELGEIPEGWPEKRVDDVMELSYGKALKSTERVDGDIPVYGSGGITGFHNEALVEGPGVIVGRKGTVGSLHWEDRPCFPIDTVFYVVPKVQLSYCYYLLETFGLERMNTDAAVPGLNRNNVYRLNFACAPDQLRNEFDEVVSKIRQKIFSNLKESQELIGLRDTLLPKLLSGELRVPDFEGVTA